MERAGQLQEGRARRGLAQAHSCCCLRCMQPRPFSPIQKSGTLLAWWMVARIVRLACAMLRATCAAAGRTQGELGRGVGPAGAAPLGQACLETQSAEHDAIAPRVADRNCGGLRAKPASMPLTRMTTEAALASSPAAGRRARRAALMRRRGECNGVGHVQGGGRCDADALYLAAGSRPANPGPCNGLQSAKNLTRGRFVHCRKDGQGDATEVRGRVTAGAGQACCKPHVR